MEPRDGFFKATHSANGKITVLCCGLVAVVRLSYPFAVVVVNVFPDFVAGAGKSVLWYAVPRLFYVYGTHTVYKLRHYRGYRHHAQGRVDLDRLLLF